ncbi:translocase [Marivita sp. S6314]|uniref:translocase n=1 Tax=Marivita sp. S6314 TaxID=2926406 RepID=UPI001FF4430C|nr:translocase [Marivita sp. S6314]MCK0150192.1 translocase [Marivita sp. S6314]
MERNTSIFIAAGTVGAALCIGAMMQYGPFSGPSTNASVVQTPLMVSDVQEVSSTPKSDLPQDLPIMSLPASVVSNPVRSFEAGPVTIPQAPESTGFTCDVDLTAETAAGAMISLELVAPCHGSERVTLHHNGLMFTELVQPDGTLSLQIPALVENALVIASFLDGSGAVAHATVPTVPFYDRVVLQWRGDAGLQLHAREFDAQYFSEGHIWHGAEADPSRAATGDGGFLTKLGSSDAPEALLAEVYTFPSGMTQNEGTVALTVEAEIQASNCDTRVEAQTLEIRDGKELTAKELTIDVPGCDTVGDFLMLKNIVEDLTIAAK